MSTNPNADYLMQRAVASGITDPSELANFMGQMQVESRSFTHLEENLHYSGGRLLTVFHGRNGIDNISAADRIAAGGPEVIANAVYGGHFGLENLGNTEPGDGYKYRGRGFVQLTGRYRYAEYSRLTGLDLVHHPELASERDNAATIAIAYWKEQVVKNHAEGSVRDATRFINNGYNGLADRRSAVAEWEQKLQYGHAAALTQAGNPPAHVHGTRDVGRGADRHASALHRGSRGDAVRVLQGELAQSGYPLHTDGDFGKETLRVVEAFQRDHGLVVDGKVGHLTRQALQTASGLAQETALIREGSRMPFGFGDPAHPQHAMYTYLKGILPAASDERFCQATAACHVAGIDKPADLSAVHITDSRMLFCAGSLFANMAEIDLARPIPAVWQSLQQVEQFDQQLQMQVRHTMQQQPSEGPVLRP